MPNHVHGIIRIDKSIDIGVENIMEMAGVQNVVGVQIFEPLPEPVQHSNQQIPKNQFQHIIPRSIGSIIRGFKIGVTKSIRQHHPGMRVWQRNYHEHIIRNEQSLNRIRHYIRNNPKQWKKML